MASPNVLPEDDIGIDRSEAQIDPNRSGCLRMEEHYSDLGGHAREMREAWERAFKGDFANLGLRIVVMFAGILCIALGIALAKLAATGTAPISSMPAVLTEMSERFGIPMTMGTWTFVFNMVFFLVEVALLRGGFHPVQLLQIPLFLVLSVAVDLWLGLLSSIPPQTYPEQLLYLGISILALGFGIRVQLASDLLMTPGDAVVQAIAYVSKRPFGTCKVIWDITLVCLAAMMSFLLLGGLYQVREGTVIAALLVGSVVKLCSKAFAPLAWLIPEASHKRIPSLCPVDAEVSADTPSRICPADTEESRILA